MQESIQSCLIKTGCNPLDSSLASPCPASQTESQSGLVHLAAKKAYHTTTQQVLGYLHDTWHVWVAGLAGWVGTESTGLRCSDPVPDRSWVEARAWQVSQTRVSDGSTVPVFRCDGTARTWGPQRTLSSELNHHAHPLWAPSLFPRATGWSTCSDLALVLPS